MNQERVTHEVVENDEVVEGVMGIDGGEIT